MKRTATRPRFAPATFCSCRVRWEVIPTDHRNRILQRKFWLAFTNLKATLGAGGCTFDDIVDVTTFHTDPEHQFPTVLTIKNENFSQTPYPTWTAIGVTWLAGFDFEIKVIARIPEPARPTRNSE